MNELLVSKLIEKYLLQQTSNCIKKFVKFELKNFQIIRNINDILNLSE